MRLGLVLVFYAATLFSQAVVERYNSLIAESKSELDSGQFDRALEVAEQAVHIDERRWEAYALAAKAYSAQKLYDDAIGMLQMALPRAPEEKKALIRRALTDTRKQQLSGGVPIPSEASNADNRS